jgi:hypothetical protein
MDTTCWVPIDWPDASSLAACQATVQPKSPNTFRSGTTCTVVTNVLVEVDEEEFGSAEASRTSGANRDMARRLLPPRRIPPIMSKRTGWRAHPPRNSCESWTLSGGSKNDIFAEKRAWFSESDRDISERECQRYPSRAGDPWPGTRGDTKCPSPLRRTQGLSERGRL